MFEKALKKLGATDQQLSELEDEIANYPMSGDVIQGLKGARKIRFRLGNKGKSGGGRAIFIAVVTADTAYLLTAYSKAAKEDLSDDDKTILRVLLKEIEND